MSAKQCRAFRGYFSDGSYDMAYHIPIYLRAKTSNRLLPNGDPELMSTKTGVLTIPYAA